MSISRKQVYEAVHSSGTLTNIDEGCQASISALCELHHCQTLPEDIVKKMSKTIKSFLYRLRERWDKCGRYHDYFIRDNNEWLKKELSFDSEVISFLDENEATNREPQLEEETAGTSARGRPPVPEWDNLSKRSKRRKAQELLEGSQPEELIFAASQGVYKKNANLKYVLKFAMQTPSRPAKIRKLISEKKTEPSKYTSEEALSLLVENGLTKQSYQNLRSSAKRKHAYIYPPYNEVREAKRKCYPDDISITEDFAKVPLQNLLDHTALRIIEDQKEQITEAVENLDAGEQLACTLVCKWGFDGSSGQSEYKQKFSSTDTSDNSLFCTTLVPLQLKYKEQVLWNNPVPSSTRFCRPIHLQFNKETTELSQNERDNIDDEIKKLKPLDVALDIDYELVSDENRRDDISVTYDLNLTMVDQKVINALTETKSTMRCYVCGATPKQFNNLQDLPPSSEEAYQYGLSPLHKWIRCFEMLLHIGYRISVEKWRVSSEADKSSVAARKKEIQDRFKSELGLKVDQPKQGSGNTNDGNTARRAFHEEEIFADICGLDVDIVHRLHVILTAVSCKSEIDSIKFGTYCHETAELLIQLYPWYKMPVSVHILLVHGGVILSSSVLPIGMMSEEAQEARNKDNKMYRRKHARKTSRVDNMSDVFHRLMVTGDIVISSISLKAPQTKPLPKEVKEMLKNIPAIEEDTDSDTSDC